MKQKSYYLLKAWLYLAGGLFILTVPLWADMSKNPAGIPLTILLTTVLGYFAFSAFKKAKQSREEDRAYAPAIDTSTDEQIKFYTRYINISLFAFPLLAYIIITDLNDLETGNVKSVSLWAPVSFVYEHFGYWTAISVVPVLGVIVVLLFYRKINTIRTSKK